jgi:small subunit ribosomal protein S17
MTEENVNQDEETQEEETQLEAGDVAEEPQATESETTAAPEGVADVENAPVEAAAEAAPEAEEATTEVEEPVAAADPPEAEPATDEPESASADAEALGEDDAQTPASSVSSSAKPRKKRLPRPLRRQRPKPKREHAAERKPITRLPKPEHARGRRQERQGTVVSAASDKTIVVRVDTVKVHPMYKKVIRRSTKLHAHDEGNQAKAGDIVRIVETRPLSKQKRWRLQEIIEAAK